MAQSSSIAALTLLRPIRNFGTASRALGKTLWSMMFGLRCAALLVEIPTPRNANQMQIEERLQPRPNPALKWDAPKAARPLASRYVLEILTVNEI